MCGRKKETASHVLCECSKLAQTEFKQRRDNVARIIRWELSKSNASKWYEHIPGGVVESDNIKLLWDFHVRPVTEHRRPGIVILDRKQGQCHIIDITVPADKWVVKKEKEKVEKYQERR